MSPYWNFINQLARHLIYYGSLRPAYTSLQTIACILVCNNQSKTSRKSLLTPIICDILSYLGPPSFLSYGIHPDVDAFANSWFFFMYLDRSTSYWCKMHDQGKPCGYMGKWKIHALNQYTMWLDAFSWCLPFLQTVVLVTSLSSLAYRKLKQEAIELYNHDI